MSGEVHNLVEKMASDDQSDNSVQSQNAQVMNTHPTDAAEGCVNCQADKKRERLLSVKYLLLLIAIYLAFIFLGGMIFHFLETSAAERHRELSIARMDAFLSNYTCITRDDVLDLMMSILEKENPQVGAAIQRFRYHESSWNFLNSMLFSTTIVTTIGYGNLTPTTPGGRAFAVFYALLGIPLFVIASGQLGVRFNAYSKRIATKFSHKSCPGKWEELKVFLTVSCAGFLLFMLCAAGIFCAAEGWTYAESLYFTFISLTTIGFGDFYPTFVTAHDDSETSHHFYSVFVTIWILLGLVWMASMMSTASDTMISLFKRWRHQSLNSKKAVEHAAAQQPDEMMVENEE